MQSIEIVKLAHEHDELLAGFFSKIDTHRYVDDFSPHPFDRDNAVRVCSYKGDDLYFGLLRNRVEMIGYFMLRGWDEGYEIPAIGLCVLDAYQGIGLGRLIMNHLEAHAQLNGASKVMLKVTKQNKTAINLYESQGFDFTEHDDKYLIGYKALRKRG